MAQIPQLYMNTVVAIGSATAQGMHWIGTGFLYGDAIPQADGSTNYKIFLVTNKHVVEGLKTVHLKFNPTNGQAGKDYELILLDHEGNNYWVGHPDPNVDVAIIEVNAHFLNEEGMVFNFFESDNFSHTSEQMMLCGYSEGDSVFAMGFPMGIVTDRKYVIVRGGIISRISDLFENRSKDFIIDAPIFPGNSGGPVISSTIFNDEGKEIVASKLIGIVKQYITFKDIAVSQQTGNPRIIFEENSGLTLVEPVDRINETITEFKRIVSVLELQQQNPAN
ncbi:S1 family peptidase [Flavobacterium hauense]